MKWIKTAGGPGEDVGHKIQVSPDGLRVYVVGFMSTPAPGATNVLFATTPFEEKADVFGGKNAFLACWKARDGRFQWVATMGGTISLLSLDLGLGADHDEAYDLKIETKEAQDWIYVTGSISSSPATFKGRQSEIQLLHREVVAGAGDIQDIFVTKVVIALMVVISIV